MFLATIVQKFDLAFRSSSRVVVTFTPMRLIPCACLLERCSARCRRCGQRPSDIRQIYAAPPSTNGSMTVTKLLSSEARKTAVLLISSASPIRPMG